MRSTNLTSLVLFSAIISAISAVVIPRQPKPAALKYCKWAEIKAGMNPPATMKHIMNGSEKSGGWYYRDDTFYPNTFMYQLDYPAGIRTNPPVPNSPALHNKVDIGTAYFRVFDVGKSDDQARWYKVAQYESCKLGYREIRAVDVYF